MGTPSRVAQERWPWRDDPAGRAVCYAITVEVLVKPITNIDDPRYVKAMSHPLRIRILALLTERTASPVELAEWLDASLGVVAYHVRTLHRFGMIDLVKETRVRGAVEHHYRAKVRPRVSDDA